MTPPAGGRGCEFVEVAQKLWDSWEDDAIVADPERGLWASARW